MKSFINSDRMRWFRRWFLNDILTGIVHEEATYCCHVLCIPRLFICWKELKEVEENMKSSYISSYYKTYISVYDCGIPWFDNRRDRIEFLNECLAKLK